MPGTLEDQTFVALGFGLMPRFGFELCTFFNKANISLFI